MYNNMNAEEILQREMNLLLPAHLDDEVRKSRIQSLRSNAIANQIGAMYFYGLYLLAEKKKSRAEADAIEETAWKWIYKAALAGSMEAKHFLDRVCEDRYREAFPAAERERSGPLTDFDGKVFKIRREGIRHPVDAILTYENGENILTLTADLNFMTNDAFSSEKEARAFEEAVMDGIRKWEGLYEVFGNQKVRIRIRLSSGENIFDCVNIIALSREQEEDALKLAEKSPWGDPRQITGSAALTAYGFRKWSTTSRKIIYFRNPDGLLKKTEYIKDIAKHEFGHVLGLGDLYVSEIFGLQGADSSEIPELQSYEILPKTYNLVMSNATGPISNNDIEMIILAFAENRMQSYQPDKINRFMSKALGKGN